MPPIHTRLFCDLLIQNLLLILLILVCLVHSALEQTIEVTFWICHFQCVKKLSFTTKQYCHVAFQHVFHFL